MLVLGVDPSTKSLAVAITNSRNQRTPEMLKIRLPEDRSQACATAFREFSSLLLDLRDETGQIPYVFLEAPVVGRGGAYSTIAQANVGGAVMAATAESGGFLRLANVSTWKKVVVGRGNMKKPEVTHAMEVVWPEAYAEADGDQDLIDAAAINIFGRKRVQLRLALLQRCGKV